MSTLEEPTRQFKDFEVISIDPLNYTREERIIAFRAGNIILATAILTGDAQTFHDYEPSVEAIGLALAE